MVSSEMILICNPDATSLTLTIVNEPGASARIKVIDVVRGVAVLGILLMNIQGFAMIQSAYFNPTSYGDFSGVNQLVWLVKRLFADQKFMTLFSLLFGAGLLLMSQRGGEGSPTARHYRRMFVLLLIGLFHAYFLWYGDILVTYALCGMVFYWARKWRPAFQMTAGVLLLAVPAILFYLPILFADEIPAEAWAGIEADWSPDAATVENELAAYRGSFGEQMPLRAAAALEMQTVLVAAWSGWRVGGLILLGMALVKTGVLKAERSGRFYWTMLATGLAVGLGIESAGVAKMFEGNWSHRLMFTNLLFNYWASLFTAGGYIAGIMLLHRAGLFQKAQQALSAVGRMALTNYLAQSVICTALFYGHGLGLFGFVPRWQQLLIALGIWGLEIVWSVWWLRRFEQGPMEWLWRCLTYLRIPPLKKVPEPIQSEEAPAPAAFER